MPSYPKNHILLVVSEILWYTQTYRKRSFYFIIAIMCLFQCMMSLQGCPLPEAAEILDILNRIEFEALFYSHHKLADLQVTCGFLEVIGSSSGLNHILTKDFKSYTVILSDTYRFYYE